MKCESGETFFTEEQGLSRLSITGSGEPTSCALAAVKELLPHGPADFKKNGLIFCTLGVLCCCFFGFAPSERERETWKAHRRDSGLQAATHRSEFFA